jgi:hypothetical protein
VHVFIRVNAHTCMSIHICTVFFFKLSYKQYNLDVKNTLNSEWSSMSITKANEVV